jgi:peptide deformylase
MKLEQIPGILLYPHPKLLEACKEVVTFDNKLHDQLDLMTKLMLAAKGIGLSANQAEFDNRALVIKTDKEIVEFVNPVLINSSKRVASNEGCLSLPGFTVQVYRDSEVQVKAQNRDGEEFNVVLEGNDAICFLHEYDHINGVFFLDLTTRQQRRYVKRQLGLK